MRQRTLFLVLFVLLIDTFSLSVVFPIFTPLILHAKQSFFSFPLSPKEKMTLLAFAIASFPVGQIIGAPLFGLLADRKGRKKAYLLSLTGEIIGNGLSAFALFYRSYSILLVSRILAGLSSGNITICYSAISDLGENDGKKRIHFTQAGTIIGLSLVLGILIGGFLSDRILDQAFSPYLPFVMISLVGFLNLLLMIFFYEEVKKPSEVHPFSLSQLQFKSLGFTYLAYFFFALSWLPLLQFFSELSLSVFRMPRISISSSLVGLATFYFLSGFVFFRWIRSEYHSKKKLIVYLCIIAVCLCCAYFTNFYPLFVGLMMIIALQAAWAWGILSYSLSKNSPQEDQGKIFGFSQSLLIIASAIAPLLLAPLLSTNERFPLIITSLSSFLTIIASLKVNI